MSEAQRGRRLNLICVTFRKSIRGLLTAVPASIHFMNAFFLNPWGHVALLLRQKRVCGGGFFFFFGHLKDLYVTSSLSDFKQIKQCYYRSSSIVTATADVTSPPHVFLQPPCSYAHVNACESHLPPLPSDP